MKTLTSEKVKKSKLEKVKMGKRGEREKVKT